MRLFKIINRIVILIFISFSTINCFGQKWDSTMYVLYLETYEQTIKSINTYFEIDSFNCSINSNMLYFYYFNLVAVIESPDRTTFLPPHGLLIIDLNEHKAMSHFMYKIKEVNPILGWKDFKRKIKELDIGTLSKTYEKIPFAKFTSPDSPNFILMTCDNQVPHYYSFFTGLTINPLEEEATTIEIKNAKNELKRIEQLLTLFNSGFD